MLIYKELVNKISIAPSKKMKQKNYLEKGKIAIIDQGHELIGGYTDDSSLIVPCDLPVIIFGDHTRTVKYVSFPFIAGADGIKILQPKQGVLPKYLYFETQYLVSKLENKGYARHYQYLEKKEVNLPTILEQERIVTHIEGMLSQLEKGVETLRKVKQQLAVYRQAVLKEAFERLTDYEVKSISEVCSDIVDCPHSTPQWTSQGQLCLRTTNFRRGYLDLSERNFVSTETFNLRNIRLKPKSGDVLYSREGAILGIACIIPENVSVCLGQRMMLLRVKKLILNKFLMHYLNSPNVTMYVTSVTGGSASPHINVGDIKKFKIPVPSITEQLKLIQTVDGRLSVCDSLEQTIDITLQQTEALRHSILKNVFEGD